MVSRRKVVLGGAAAVAAIPVARHVQWNMKDYVREDYRAELAPAPEGETAWMNWSGIERATPKQLAAPANVKEVAEFVATSKGRVRPVGSGHSFTGLVPSEDTIMDISRISGITQHTPGSNVVTIGAGTRLRQSSRALSKLGLAWPNLPDIDVQTIAGSFATATHGTGLTHTAIHARAKGFTLVTARGDVLEVDRDRNPDLFRAGQVSLGALGVITHYTLELVPSFNLRRKVWVEPAEDVLAKAEEMANQHLHFEAYYFPSTDYMALITHDLHEGEVTGRGDSEDESTLSDLEDLRNILGWAPWLRRKLMEGLIPDGPVEDCSDESWRLLSSSRPTRFIEMEYHLPYDEGIKTMRQIKEYFDSRKDLYFPIELRFTGKDDAWLSPFNDGQGVSIATHAAVDEAYDYLFTDVEPIHRAAGGRPHWGKLHSLGREELSTLYPRFDDFNAIRKDLDPDGKFLNPHLAKLFGESL